MTEPTTIDPTGEYSDADYRAMAAALAAKQARENAQVAQRRADYANALRPVVTAATFDDLRDNLKAAAASVPADDNLSMHVANALMALSRIAAGVAAVAPADVV